MPFGLDADVLARIGHWYHGLWARPDRKPDAFVRSTRNRSRRRSRRSGGLLQSGRPDRREVAEMPRELRHDMRPEPLDRGDRLPLRETGDAHEAADMRGAQELDLAR